MLSCRWGVSACGSRCIFSWRPIPLRQLRFQAEQSWRLRWQKYHLWNCCFHSPMSHLCCSINRLLSCIDYHKFDKRKLRDTCDSQECCLNKLYSWVCQFRCHSWRVGNQGSTGCNQFCQGRNHIQSWCNCKQHSSKCWLRCQSGPSRNMEI